MNEMTQNQPKKTIEEYFEIGEKLTKQRYSEIKLEDWKKECSDFAQEFYADFFLLPLSRPHSTVLARYIIFFSKEQQLKVIEHVFNVIRVPDYDFNLQGAYGGILYYACNHFEDDQIKDLLKIKKDEFNSRYSLPFVDLIRKYR